MARIDKYSYELGVIDCFSEMVSTGVKMLAMSHPCDTKEERDAYEEDVKRLCEKYEIFYYPEDEAFLTDLFPPEANRDKYNYLLYRKKETLDTYLVLKERQKRLKEAGAYEGQARRDIAAGFGRLLSYPEEGIDRLIEKAKKGWE